MKRLLKLVLGTLFTVVLLLLAIPLFVSAETLKKQVAEQASKATGRAVELKGDASLTLFPNIAVSVKDVTVGNPAGFKSPYLIKAETLAAGAALGPLLSGNLNITGITLHGADIRLEQTAAGAKNWEFTTAKAASTPAESKGGASAKIKSFALGDISIKDSAVTYNAPGKSTKAEALNLVVKGADGRSSLIVDGSGRYQGKDVKISAKVEKPRSFLASEASPAGIQLKLPGGTVNFSGKAQLGDAVGAVGALTLDVNDVPGLVGWATGKPAKGLPKSIDLKADTTIKGKRFSLKDATLTVDDVTATGDIAANLEGAVPAISGTLKFGMLDLNTLMKTASAEPKRGWMDAYAAEPQGWSSAPLDLSALRSVNANLNITADKLRQGKLEVSDIAVQPQLSGGNLNLAIKKAALYGGQATGTITASANGSQSMGADLDFSGIQIEPFLMALKGDTRLRGTAALKLNVKGSGTSEQAIVSNLNGNGSMKVVDGAIKGMNLAGLWRDLKQGFLYGSPSQSTDFSELSGTFTIAQGIVSNSDLAMKSPALRVSGKGTVDLPRRQLNYRLVPSIVDTMKGQGGKERTGLDVPIDIRGSVDNPSVTPDLAGMVQKQLEDPAALKQSIKDIKETIKDFNSPEDIGKALLGGGKQAEPAAATPPATGETVPAPAPTPEQPAAATPAPPPTKEEQIMKGVGELLKGI